ncbi:MAG: hypothetical protein INH41_18075 [Myxococcaceae bacterium]|nr:hypothetical protein [Myxococcaceae bacterium]
MSRYAKATTADLLSLLTWAPRRRTNPFAVMEALGEVLDRRVAPPEVGAAVLAFDATLAAEAREALDPKRGATARFLQATVPADVDGPRVEVAWQGAAHALARLVRLTRAPTLRQLEVLRRLAGDEVVLEGAQVALSTAEPADVETNRWFFPVLVLDGREASVDALMPHLAAASAGGAAAAALRPLAKLSSASSGVAALLAKLSR